MTVNVVIPGLTIVKTADTSTAEPGTVVGYTVTVTDSGQTSYSRRGRHRRPHRGRGQRRLQRRRVRDGGSGELCGPNLTWTGSLSPGNSATITWSRHPDTDGKLLAQYGRLVRRGGRACPPGTTSVPCQVTVAVLTPGLPIAKTASTATAVPGQTVTYTITVTDSGQTPYTGATLHRPAGRGPRRRRLQRRRRAPPPEACRYAAPNLTWTGNLSPGDSATITYSVTVNNPDTGNETLTNTVTSPTPGSNCPVGGTDPSCTSTVPVSVLAITNTANVSTTTPGSTVRYTVTVTNTGRVDLSDINFSLPLSDVVDDAAYNNNATATAGLVSFAGSELTWDGDLDQGQSATIRFTVTVNNQVTGN